MGNSMALKRPLQAGSEKLSKKLRLEDSPYSSTALASTYGEPLSLDLNCQIFLSHSGRDKEFVRDLYDALCCRYLDKQVAFFDEESLSLRKAVAISMKNIVGEAKKSKLGVVVITEDFFVQTANPMLELEAFKAAEVELLPLFFGMSVDQFKEKRGTGSWEQVWRKWSIKQLGGRTNVEEVLKDWRCSLDLVTTFSGLEYKMFTSQQDYIRRIVDRVTCIIPPHNLFSDEGVCGKDRLCQMVDKMYERCVAQRLPSIDHKDAEAASTFGSATMDLVGIHGFSGLGKTTLCKCLLDFYFPKFKGKVCYIDVASREDSVLGRLQHVSSRFGTGNNGGFSHSQDIDQLKNMFRRQLSWLKDPVFLVIDNILPDGESEEEAEFYLDCEFPKGSRIFMTSKSERILTNLSSLHRCSFSDVVEYMPALQFEEARDIFVRNFPPLRKDGFLDLQDDVNECVSMCTIHGKVYHPLMLRSVAALIKSGHYERHLGWKERLAKLRLEGNSIIHKGNAWLKVFEVFDRAYALLSKEAQKVFLELVLFYNAGGCSWEMYEWIQIVYPNFRKMDEIIWQLHDLCFLEMEGRIIKILDLMVEYGKYKARQSDVHPEYVVVDDEHCWDDPPRRARTISISKLGLDMRSPMLDLRHIEGVNVLHIVDNAGLKEVLLSRSTCSRLRSLIVSVPVGASLSCTYDEDCASLEAYTSSWLEWARLHGNVCFRPLQFSVPVSPINYAIFGSLRNLQITSVSAAMDLVSGLRYLRNLEFLRVYELPGVQSIDVSTCANLKKLRVSFMQELELINGLENTNLEDVDIGSCDKMLTLTFPADSKTNFSISRCRCLERLSFSTMPSYRAGAYSGCTESRLSVRDCHHIANVDGLSQYTGGFEWKLKHGGRWGGGFGDLLNLDDGVDYSICKGAIQQLVLTGYNPAGLAGVKVFDLVKARHAGLIISALFKAQPEDLQFLSICCNGRGDCGCKQNVPHFGSLPTRLKFDDEVPTFRYWCPRVKDLASLAQWHGLKCLVLCGCTNVRVWPDFAAMTSLESLYLSNTSLKKWPASVLHLSHLKNFDVRACRKLPAKELMKVVKSELQPRRLGIVACIISSLASLRDDLKSGKRDRLSIAKALDRFYPELTTLFGLSSWSLHEVLVVEIVVAIMYNVWWFGKMDATQDLVGVREKMRRLLCSKSFLSLPFSCACRQSFLLPSSRLPQLSTREGTNWVIYSKSVLMSFPSSAGGKWESGLKDHAMRGVCWMAMALVGAGSVACFDASPDDVRENFIDFRKSGHQLEEEAQMDIGNSSLYIPYFHFGMPNQLDMYPLGNKEDILLRKRASEAWSRLVLEMGLSDSSSSDDDEADFSADISDDEKDRQGSCSVRNLAFSADGTIKPDIVFTYATGFVRRV